MMVLWLYFLCSSMSTQCNFISLTMTNHGWNLPPATVPAAEPPPFHQTANLIIFRGLQWGRGTSQRALWPSEVSPFPFFLVQQKGAEDGESPSSLVKSRVLRGKFPDGSCRSFRVQGKYKLFLPSKNCGFLDRYKCITVQFFVFFLSGIRFRDFFLHKNALRGNTSFSDEKQKIFIQK